MPTAKKKPVKKTAKKTAAHQRSFVRSSETGPFMTFRVTHQTLYWLIICLLVLAVGVWALYLTARVNGLYDDLQLRSTEAPLMHHK